nr:hypothetical protein CFP56_62200 [Quercus suber]
MRERVDGCLETGKGSCRKAGEDPCSPCSHHDMELQPDMPSLAGSTPCDRHQGWKLSIGQLVAESADPLRKPDPAAGYERTALRSVIV